MSGAPLYDLLHLQQVSLNSAHVLISVKGVTVDVFNSGEGVEGKLMDFDDGGDSSLSYFSNARAAGYEALKGFAETSHDERVFIDVHTCGGCFVGNVIYHVADFGYSDG
jgi:hypothetical protein